MNKTPWASQNTEAITLPPTFVFLAALNASHRLQFTLLTTVLTPEYSDGSRFRLLSHTDAKNSVYFGETIPNSARNQRHVVSKRGTYFDNSFFIDKCSCKIAYTLPHDIFKVSYIPRNFNLRFSKTILWTFLMVSGVTTSFDRPERSASSVSVRPRLNSAYHRQMVVSDGAESP